MEIIILFIISVIVFKNIEIDRLEKEEEKKHTNIINKHIEDFRYHHKQNK